MNDQHHTDDQHAPPIDKPPSVPLQPVVGSPYFQTPRTDAMIEERRNLPTLECGSTDGGWSAEDVAAFMALSKQLERELSEALCAIRQLLNDGVQVQNLNNGEVDQFRADVDGIVAFLEATDAKARLARRTSNPTEQGTPHETAKED